MKKLLYLLPIFLFSCDDGDVIVQEFDFENVSVDACESDFLNSNEYIFYKNNGQETIFIQFSTTDGILLENNTYGNYSVGTNNSIEYRKLSDDIPSDYYCNNIPIQGIDVLDVFTATAGDISIVTITNSETDNDGIPNELETGDYDNDGIPDIIDLDDDGDNVPTVDEGVVITNGMIDLTLSRDTDSDGILDYLDTDDDGDGILTSQEDVDGDLNPRNDITNGIPNYLNPAVTDTFTTTIDTAIPNNYSRSSNLDITISNLILTDGNNEVLLGTFDFGTYISPVLTIETTGEVNTVITN